MDDIKRYLTVRQVAKKLGYTEEWVRDLIKAERIRAIKIKQWRIKPGELDRFLKSRSNF